MQKALFILLATTLFALSAASGRSVRVDDPASLQRAVRTAQPGDTVLVGDGIWTDAKIILNGNGTADAPIVVRAENPGQLVLQGRSSLTVRGKHLVIEGFHFRDGWLDSGHVILLDGSHLTLRQTAIDSYNNPDREVRYFWVSLRGSHHLVEQCAFRGMNHSGVTLAVWRTSDSADHHRIRRNYFADRPQGTGNGWETIRIGDSQQSLSDSHTLVEENLFERCDGEVEIISSKSGRNIFRRNTFRASKGTLTLRHGNSCIVDGNFFLGEDVPSTGGIRVIGEDHVITNNYIEKTAGRGGAAIAINSGTADGKLHEYFAANRAKITANTIVDVKGPHIHLAHGYGNHRRTILPEEVAITGNLLIDSRKSSGVLVEGEAGPNLRIEKNVGYGRSPGKLPLADLHAEQPRLKRDASGILRLESGTVRAHRPLAPEDVGISW